jgi:signal transduction histidine kinase
MAVNVTKALVHALEQVRAQGSKKHIILKLDCPLVLPPAKGNALQLERLLRTLLMHAIQVSSKGGVVQVFAVTTRHGVGGKSDSVAVVVTDNGTGLQRRGFDRLFGAYRPAGVLELHGVSRGAQVLSLTCRLGLFKGGRVWVKSKAGRGSILAAVLPVTRSRPTTAMTAPNAGNRPSRVTP